MSDKSSKIGSMMELAAKKFLQILKRRRVIMFVSLGMLTLLCLSVSLSGNKELSEFIHPLSLILVGYPTYVYFVHFLMNITPSNANESVRLLLTFLATGGVVVFEVLYLWLLAVVVDFLIKKASRR